VQPAFLHIGLLHRYTLETFSCAVCRYHISEEDDTHYWHKDGLFDVPRASIMDGVVHDHNSPRSD